VKLDLIRPGKPVENGYIESFNGRLRDECLNGEIFFDLADARQKLEHWRRDYNERRPHSSLADRTPAEFAREARERSFTLPIVDKAGQQLREAFPFDRVPRNLLRGRDGIFGREFRTGVAAMGIKEVLSTPDHPGNVPLWNASSARSGVNASIT
jgi:Integrase core domain